MKEEKNLENSKEEMSREQLIEKLKQYEVTLMTLQEQTTLKDEGIFRQALLYKIDKLTDTLIKIGRVIEASSTKIEIENDREEKENEESNEEDNEEDEQEEEPESPPKKKDKSKQEDSTEDDEDTDVKRRGRPPKKLTRYKLDYDEED